MTDAEFYSLTPRQYNLLLRRHEEAQRQQELQTGILASTFANYTANWSMNPPKQGMRLKPADFMPSELAKVRRKKRISKQSVAKQFTFSARCWMEAMKGRPDTIIKKD